jgi:PIN domain nuclease of toxin-antitoxin system
MVGEERQLLLDTHALIWLAEGMITPELGDRLSRAAQVERLYVSTATALEIGFLSRPERQPDRRLVFPPDAATWFGRLVERARLRVAELTPEIAIRSSFLPGEFHRDPIDRLLITTARELDLDLVTRDSAILKYSARGHVRTLAC